MASYVEKHKLILSENDLELYYHTQQQNGYSSFEIFLGLMQMYNSTKTKNFNMLVGASSSYENDLYRFGNCDDYSLNIDSRQKEFTSREQSKMFTINWEDIYEHLHKLPYEFVDNMHFDTGVSYLASIKYLLVASHMLKVNGKIVWDLENHSSGAIFYRSNKQKYYSGVDYSEISEHEVDELFDLHGVTKIVDDNHEHTIIPKDNSFFENGEINPQMPWVIIDLDKHNKRCATMPKLNFLDYCVKYHPNFVFQEKHYTYADYVYPTPIRIQPHPDNPNDFLVATYSACINFVANNIMNQGERNYYVTTKKLSIEKLIQLVDRIFTNPSIKKLLLSSKIIPPDVLSICGTSDGYDDDVLKLTVNNYFHEKFFKEKYMFIEATKVC